MMEPKIIRAEELEEENHGDTKTTSILNIKDLKFNVSKIRKIGNNVKLGYDTESDVVYYVLEGEGDCIINGEKHHLKKGDLAFYPKGTKYKHLKGLVDCKIVMPE